MHFVILADAAEGPVVQEAQQFGLHTRRHFADFIQQHGAAVRLLEEAFLPFRRVTKQLAFNGIFRDRGAVKRQIRFCRARAGQVAGVRQQIFSGTGIAGNQQRRGQAGKLARLVNHMTHFRADGNNLAERADILAGEVLQLATHAQRRAQHDHRTGQYAGVSFPFQIDRA